MRPDWDSYFMALLEPIAARSHDTSTKVACLMIGPGHEIRTTGFNGFPRGAREDVPGRYERPEKYLWTEHAERNAIYNAARSGITLAGCTAYISLMPCMDCARGMVQSGIVRVVVDKVQSDARRHDPKWEADFDLVWVLLNECGVGLDRWTTERDE